MTLPKLDSVFDPILAYHLAHLESRQHCGNYQSLSDEFKLKSVGTARVDVGRQTGKTHYIARTASDEDLIFCENSNVQKLLIERTTIFGHSGCQNIHLFVDTPPDGQFEDVWIDDGSQIYESDLNRLYVILAGRCRRFILIG